MYTYPFVRVIVPAYNADATIAVCVAAIAAAVTFLNAYEILVVDNSGSDGLEHLLSAFRVKIIKRTAIASAAYARNEGAAGCAQGILVFIDSDVICEKDCIAKLIAPVCENKCHAAIGNYSKNVTGLSFAQKYKQLYINHIYGSKTDIRNDYWTAIAAIDASVFHDIGGFDSNFKGANGEDQEFGIRLTRAGYQVLAVPGANGQHINPYTVHKIVKNDFRKGVTAVQNCINNKVPLSDNRHAGSAAILAVISAVLTTYFLALAIFFPACLYLSAAAFGAWLLFRLKLKIAFAHMGIVFLLQSVLLMFILDLTRCAALIAGVGKNRLRLLQKKTFSIKIPT